MSCLMPHWALVSDKIQLERDTACTLYIHCYVVCYPGIIVVMFVHVIKAARSESMQPLCCVEGCMVCELWCVGSGWSGLLWPWVH